MMVKMVRFGFSAGLFPSVLPTEDHLFEYRIFSTDVEITLYHILPIMHNVTFWR